MEIVPTIYKAFKESSMIAGKFLSILYKPGWMHFLMWSSMKKGEKKKLLREKEWEFEEVK